MSETKQAEKSKCSICGDTTSRPFAAFVYHFRPIYWEGRNFIKGNFRTFGFWGGLRANLTLMFPFVNTIWNWKYRKDRLEIEEAE